jgi:hypothetical protein
MEDGADRKGFSLSTLFCQVKKEVKYYQEFI